jgi:hypothetical protein
MTPDGRSIPTILRDSAIGLLDELELKQPYMADSSLAGILALQTAAAGRAASVTALSPAGFWTSGLELSYVIAVNQAMRAIGRRIRPLGRAMSRSSPGRAIIHASIVAKPSPVSPEQAWGDMTSSLNSAGAMKAILAAPITDDPQLVADVLLHGSRARLAHQRQNRAAL